MTYNGSEGWKMGVGIHVQDPACTWIPV